MKSNHLFVPSFLFVCALQQCQNWSLDAKIKSHLSRNNFQNNSILDKSYVRNSENKEKEKKVEPQDHLSWLSLTKRTNNLILI